MNHIPFSHTASRTASTRFHSVISVFESHFMDQIEHGAQFCVCQHGEIILDLYGGWANRQKSRPVDAETLFAIFSSGKAITAILIACLVEQNRLDYVQKVSHLWPEFSACGKADLTVAEVLSHQAGLSGICDPNWQVQDWYDWDKVCQTLAAQAPLFPPTSTSGYHPITFGFLAGEIAQRADPAKRSLKQILRQEITIPHKLDIWLGLPESEHVRCADMIKPRTLANFGTITEATRAAFLKPYASPMSAGLKLWRQAEFAGANMHATARALAQCMQICVDGQLSGSRILSENTRTALCASRHYGADNVLPFTLDFAAGLIRNAPNFFYGPNPEAVGHSGWGGACVLADPKRGISAAYVMSQQTASLLGDNRPQRLIQALYDALG